MDFIIAQIISFVFAIATALHDVPAINSFAKYGSTDSEQKKFHWCNWILKACFVVVASVLWTYKHPWPSGIFVGLCLLLIIWAFFDPAVNKYRATVKKWWYLSRGPQIDRFLLDHFGEKAGVWKFGFCIALTIILNFLQIFFYGF